MSEAFIPLIDPTKGRIVNIGSNAGANYVANHCEPEDKELLSSKQISWEELEAFVDVARIECPAMYGLSKAALHKYTEICAKENQNLKISAVSPGFINTAMKKGLGAKTKPE